MASSRLLSSSLKSPSFNLSLNSSTNTSSPSLYFSKPSTTISVFKNKKFQLRSEIRSFDNPHNLTVESDPVLSFDNSSPSSVSMAASSSAVEPSLKNGKQVCLFYCAETKALAQRVASQSDAIDLRSIDWRKFDDGFPNIFIPNAPGIRGKHVAFLAPFTSPGVIFEQLSVTYALPKLFVSSFTLVLPFFSTGTSERMEDEGDVATAFTLARAL